MSLVDRATAITLRPNTTWSVIAAESEPPAAIFAGYVAPLAAIGPIASAIGLSIIGIGMGVFGTYREPFVSAIVRAAVTYVMILIGVGIITAIAAALAPNFGGRRDTLAALKLVAYAYTPAFIAGILSLIPQLAALELLAALWTLYVFYLGAPALLLCAKDKALPYTATCVVCAVVLGAVVGLIISTLGFAGMGFGGPRLGMNATQNQSATVDAAVAAIAARPASTDPAAQAAQAMQAVSSLVTGNKAPVKLISSDALKTLLPASVAGLAQAADDGTTSSIAGISGTSAQATYGTTNDAKIDLTVADLGNASGIAALANLGASMNVQSAGDSGYEKNVQVDGRQVHEKWTAAGKQSELTAIAGNRYAVTVEAHGVGMDAALSALQSVDLSKFEALGAAAQ